MVWGFRKDGLGAGLGVEANGFKVRLQAKNSVGLKGQSRLDSTRHLVVR